MMIQQIALVPADEAVDPAELARVGAALQKQVLRDVAPLWGASACVAAFPRLEELPLGYWPIVVRELVVPALEPNPEPEARPVTAPAPRPTTSAASRPTRDTLPGSHRTPTEWAGITLLSVSGAAFVTSIGFVLRATHQENVSENYCTPECDADGKAALDASERARDGALISGMVGLGVAVAGVVTYVWGRQQRPQHARASAAPWFTGTGAGAGAHVSF